MNYPSREARIRARQQMCKPDYFFRGKSWGEIYAYICEWHCMCCGTLTRYHWLRSRGRFSADADAYLF